MVPVRLGTIWAKLFFLIFSVILWGMVKTYIWVPCKEWHVSAWKKKNQMEKKNKSNLRKKNQIKRWKKKTKSFFQLVFWYNLIWFFFSTKFDLVLWFEILFFLFFIHLALFFIPTCIFSWGFQQTFQDPQQNPNI